MLLKPVGHSFIFLLVSFSINAGELISSSVEHDDNRYVMEFDMRINARPADVYLMVTDFNHLGRVNENIKESKILSTTDAQHHRVKVTSEACALFFCKTIRQVQDIELINDEVVIATVVPELSDFDYAHARWYIRADGDGTRITFNADLKPSFWVPPLIGPGIIEGKLEDEVIGTIENIEKLLNTNDTNTVQ